MSNNLNEKQKRFCYEYIKDFNGTQAAIRAGYSKTSATSTSSEILSYPNVQDFLKTLTDKTAKKFEAKYDVTIERVNDEFAKIAFSSIAHLHNTWITRKEFEELTPDQKDCIQEIKTRVKKYKTDNGDIVEDEEIQIKLYDKQRALENLGKHLGYYLEDNKQKTPTIISGIEMIVPKDENNTKTDK